MRRVLIDRKWTVGELAAATLQHAKETLDEHENGPLSGGGCSLNVTFFDKLLGLEPSET